MGSTGLEGKSVLVTGGGSGIGRAMCLAFAAEGAKVVVSDISEAGATETAKLVAEAGGTALVVTADVSDEASVEALVAATVEAHGGIDVLCNNAGVLDSMSPIEDVSTAEWQRTIAINLTGPFLVTRAAIPHLLANRGSSIINTASAAGIRGGCGGPSYTASKHGITGLMKALSNALGEYDIRVNSIHPAGVETEMMNVPGLLELINAKAETLGPLFMNTLPHFSMPPADISNAVLWLASDDSRMVTGDQVRVDMGLCNR